MEVKVSIILPSLNVRNYIEKAVRSAMEQTLREIEILCIDAGSDDGTWEILSELAKADERIILCRSAVKSYGYQVNMGIDMAKGEYIAILETDDYADAQMYEKMYQETVLQDYDFVKSDYFLYRTQNDGKRIFMRRYSFQDDELYGRPVEPVQYSAVAVGDWYLWTGIYKKQFLTGHGIRLAETPGAAYQDIGFIFQTNLYAKKALYVKEAYYRYCVDREGASANSGKGLQYAYQEFYRLYEMLQAEQTQKKVWQAFYCRMAKSFVYCCEGMEDGCIKIDSVQQSVYYTWFMQQLNDAIENNLVDRLAFQPKVWQKLEDLLVSEAYYIEKCKAHKKKIWDTVGKPGQYMVVIFGCGHYGYEACKWLESHAYTVEAYIDNNRELWGTTIDGIIVEAVSRVTERLGKAKYVIANEKYSVEMKEQLLSMGVAEADLCIYV